MSPCMCGDICCWSCGPAQGNWQCPLCEAWASEGCKHISVKTGLLKLRYQKIAKKLEEVYRQNDEELLRQLAEEKEAK